MYNPCINEVAMRESFMNMWPETEGGGTHRMLPLAILLRYMKEGKNGDVKHIIAF